MAWWRRKKDDDRTRKPAGKPMDLGVRLAGAKAPIGLPLKGEDWKKLKELIGAQTVGMMAQKKLGATMAERMYVTQNVAFSLFNGQIEMAPRLDHFNPPPKEHLADGYWTTTVFLSFAGGRLFRMIFENNGDEAAAKWLFNSIVRAAGAEFGPSEKPEEDELDTEGEELKWKNRSSLLALNRQKDSVVVTLAVNPDNL